MILTRLPVQVVRSSTIARALEKLDVRTSGVLIAHLDRDPLPVEGISRLASRVPHQVPVFSVVPDATDDVQAQKHYELGASMVFRWPSETFLMASMICAQMSEFERSSKPSRTADERLHRALSLRLAQGPSDISELGFVLNKGTVQLFGRMFSQADRSDVIQRVQRTPGVIFLDPSNVEIERAKTLEHRVRNLLQKMPDVQQETLSSHVEEGRVTLVGTVASKRELDRVIETIGRIPDVEKINNLTTISKAQKQLDAEHAHALDHALSRRFPNADIDVSVFGSVAVLDGVARSGRSKTQIGAFTHRKPFVEHVVDRVSVHS